MPQNNNLSSFIEGLHQTANFDSAFMFYQERIMAMGYEGILYGYAPAIYSPDHPVFNTPVYRATGLYRSDFLQHYAEQGYYKDDYTVKAILKGDMQVIDWWEAVRLNQLTIREVNVLKASRNYGLENGLTIPIMNNRQGFSGISVASSEKRREFKKLNKLHQQTLKDFTSVFNAHVWTHHYSDMLRLFTKPVYDTLTELEKNLIRELPHHKNLTEVAKKLNKNRSYCENRLSKVREKLGNITTYQIVSYSSLLRFDDF